MIFKPTKILLVLSTITLISSCVQSYNSNYGDKATYGDIGIDSSTNLYFAYKVIQSKCLPCHSTWKDYKTSQQWIDEGLIVSGSPTSSSIYTNLSNVGGSMPKDPYESLTTEELAYIREWITNPE
jgi:hypothetical protein